MGSRCEDGLRKEDGSIASRIVTIQSRKEREREEINRNKGKYKRQNECWRAMRKYGGEVWKRCAQTVAPFNMTCLGRVCPRPEDEMTLNGSEWDRSICLRFHREQVALHLNFEGSRSSRERRHDPASCPFSSTHLRPKLLMAIIQTDKDRCCI